jgi:hypothetical protein
LGNLRGPPAYVAFATWVRGRARALIQIARPDGHGCSWRRAGFCSEKGSAVSEPGVGVPEAVSVSLEDAQILALESGTIRAHTLKVVLLQDAPGPSVVPQLRAHCRAVGERATSRSTCVNRGRLLARC